MDKEQERRIEDKLYYVQCWSQAAFHAITNLRPIIGDEAAQASLLRCVGNIGTNLAGILEEFAKPRLPQRPGSPNCEYLQARRERRKASFCRGLKKSGKPCSAPREGGTAYCRHHQGQAADGTLAKVAAMVDQLAHKLAKEDGGANG